MTRGDMAPARAFDLTTSLPGDFWGLQLLIDEWPCQVEPLSQTPPAPSLRRLYCPQVKNPISPVCAVLRDRKHKTLSSHHETQAQHANPGFVQGAARWSKGGTYHDSQEAFRGGPKSDRTSISALKVVGF